MRWLFPCTFPNFSQHKMQHHPPATVTAAQHISGASLNFPRCFRTSAKLFTAMSVSRCSGPSCRSRASRPRRSSGSASAKAPRASSTYASLGRGSPPGPKSSHGFVEERAHVFTICGVVAYFWIQVPGGKTRFWDSIYSDFTWAVATGYTDWCYLMLVVNNVAYCNLQLSLCGFAAFLDANLWWQDNTVLDSTNSTNTCLLMCWSLGRDWDPHRLSAWSALSCSGPNLSAVASARHRSLGPWWCLSHGCAYHMAMRWSTMSPTWKTDQVQENGQRYAKSSRCGKASSFSQKLPGYWAAIDGPCFKCGIFNQMFLRVRAGGRFFKLADVCPTWSGKIQVNL